MDNSSKCFVSDIKLKSSSDSSLLTMYKLKKKNEKSLSDNEDFQLSKLISNKIAIDKSPKSTDTLYEIPDMPSSAGSSFCRSSTSSSCSNQSTITNDDVELPCSDTECDVCSSALTLVSQSYVPSDSSSPALRCSFPIKDDTFLVVLDSATAILQLPSTVTHCAASKATTNDELPKSKLSFTNKINDCRIAKPEVKPRCKIRDFKLDEQNKQQHSTSTIPIYLVEVLPGQFMAFPTDMSGPLGPNPTSNQMQPSTHYLENCEPKLRQPIPLYHTVVNYENDLKKINDNCNKFQNEINTSNNIHNSNNNNKEDNT